MIEAAIQGKPVFTIVDSSFDNTQTGTLHFRYLLPENGGHLQRAADLHEHVRQLVATIDAGESPSSRQFVETFVRPHGLDVSATPRFVAALEGLRDTVPLSPDTVPLYLVPLRVLLWTMGVVASRKQFKKRLIRVTVDSWSRLKSRLRELFMSRAAHRPSLPKSVLDAGGASGDVTEATVSKQKQHQRRRLL